MEKTLLSFCGTLDADHKYTTIGDIMAVYNVAQKLNGFGIDYKIAYTGHIIDLNNKRVDVNKIDLSDYTDLLHVCGPVSHTTKQLCEIFSAKQRTAIGVSAASIDPKDIFHNVYIRDSRDVTNFDFAVADIGFPHMCVDQRHRRPGLSLCLVGSQGEYGSDNGSDLFVRELKKLIAALGVKRIASVQTLIRPNFPNPLNAEIDIQCSQVAFTNRMHGALLAIYHRVPVIAFDQIKGGAKVTRMMNKIGWPVFNFYNFDSDKFKIFYKECKAGWNDEFMESCRSRMIHESNSALNEAVNMFAERNL
jgi:hypothetical protein